MNISGSSGLQTYFNDIITSLMYVESFDLLAERTVAIIMQLPEIRHVSVIFQSNILQKPKIADNIISIPLIGDDHIFGKIDIECEKSIHATNELISILVTVSNVSAAVCSKIKKINENKILATLAKETDYAIVITDPNGKIEWVNDGFEQLSEYKLSEVEGLRINDISQGIDTDIEKTKLIINALKNKKNIELEYLNYTKSGKKYWVNIEIKPLFENGILTHYISIQKDISSLKNVEEELIQSKDLAESANEAKNRFLAITSHEIRTPLNIILGMSKILLETEINDSQLKYLRGIKSASQNLLLIINDLLDFSKIEAGKLLLEKIEFNLNQVTEDAMTFLSIKAIEKNIQLVLDNDTRIYDFLIGDPFRLNQILLNLLTNALKFTDTGTITLRTHLEYENDIENKIKIEVSDTGIGIDSKKINTIFDSYTQEDISITRKYGGTGLGLTITKQLVELFGGEISVYSNKISGTTFIIMLTFKKSKKTDSKIIEPIIDIQSLKGIKVLLAEDNELNQVIALTYLNRWEIETDTVLNGLEAIVNVKNKKYDIILMDIQMPEMDGITATKIIRHELLSKTPIIALTAHALNDEREKYMQAGFDEYVTKPIDENILLTSLLKHVEPSLSNNYTHIESKMTKSNSIEEPIFNLSELKKIAINDTQFIPKIIQLFINQSIDIPEKLTMFVENKNITEIGFIIHQIKPSLFHLSVDCSKDIIRKIEENIHDNKNEEETLQLSFQLIPILNTLLVQLNTELEKYSNSI